MTDNEKYKLIQDAKSNLFAYLYDEFSIAVLCSDIEQIIQLSEKITKARKLDSGSNETK